ncbi:hypothetical protein MHYP_G00012500 [Metynnis hypsauchen]
MGVNDVQCLHTFGCVLQLWRARPRTATPRSRPGPAPAPRASNKIPRHLAPLFLRVYRRRLREQRGAAARRAGAEQFRLCLPPQLTDRLRHGADWTGMHQA